MGMYENVFEAKVFKMKKNTVIEMKENILATCKFQNILTRNV